MCQRKEYYQTLIFKTKYNMKTKLVPFDLEKAKNGAKIVTRTGLNVRIGFQDVKNGDNPILGLVSVSDYTETPMFYTKDGRHMEGFVSDYDLFIEEEVEEYYNPYKIAIEVLAKMVKLYSSADSDELKDFYNEVKAKCREAVEYDNIWNKKQNEQTTKIEPKFKVGDWITQEIAGAGVFKITKICKSWYEVIDSECCHYSISFDNEYMCHIWTIQDAKDGDVLVCIGGKYGQEIGIVKKYVGKYGGCDKCFETYCFVDWEGIFRLGEYMGSKEIYPATKEQSDLLFQKMKEAGYEWNSDKKELHKIEEVKKRRMTHQELAWWLREKPEEHRELKMSVDDPIVDSLYYYDNETNVTVSKDIIIRKNGGEWEEPLIEE